MQKPLRVLILGGRGYFGGRLAERLLRLSDVEVLTAGRHRLPDPCHYWIDAGAANLVDRLESLDLDVLVAAIGPFAGGARSHRLARAAIRAGIHYIDLADSREHVAAVSALDQRARAAGVMVVSGASSVPALSSAVIDQLAGEFSSVEHIDCGISASELTPGVDAIRSALAYCGRPILSKGTARRRIFGWQGGVWKKFGSPLGWRWLLPCDVPDLDLMPDRYGVERMDFRAGVAGFPHMLAMWSLSWLVRIGLVDAVQGLAPILHTIAKKLEFVGSGRSGMYVVLTGLDGNRQPLTREWQLTAENNDGPYVPVLAAVALVRKLAAGCVPVIGAMPCMGLLTLSDIEKEARGLRISWNEGAADCTRASRGFRFYSKFLSS